MKKISQISNPPRINSGNYGFATSKPVGTRIVKNALTLLQVHAIHLIMYLRTTLQKNKVGPVVFQVTQYERNPVTAKPVPNIIHNLGSTVQLVGLRAAGEAMPVQRMSLPGDRAWSGSGGLL